MGSRPLKNRMKIGRHLILSVAFVALALGLYAVHPYYLSAMGRYLIVSDPLARADAIIVLAGGAPKDERLLQAIKLWEAGKAPHVVLSARLADWQSIEDHTSWRHAKKLRLLPDSALSAFTHEADSTKEEAKLVLSFVREQGYRSVIIVTSNFHTRRSKKVYQEQWASADVNFRISAAPTSKFRPDDWWTRRTDSRTFFYEFTKTIWYTLFE